MTGRFPLLAPVAVALLIRLVAWCGAEWALEVRQAEFLVPGDAGGYVELSADVASGRPYAIDEDVPFSRRAMRPPLFPLVLAGPVAADLRLFPVRAPGYGKWLLARLAVVLLATAAVWATGRLGTAVAGPRVGAAAAWLAAVNPLAVAFGVMLLSESLFALLATLSLWGVAECVRPDDSRAKPSPRWQPAVWGGLAAAGAALTRSVWLPMPFAVAALTFILAARGASRGVRRAGAVNPSARASGYQTNWKWAGVFLLAFGVGYAPWPLRNLAVLGEPVLTTTWAGPTLYDSLGPQATGASDMRFIERDERRVNGTFSELSVVAPDERQALMALRRSLRVPMRTACRSSFNGGRPPSRGRGQIRRPGRPRSRTPICWRSPGSSSRRSSSRLGKTSANRNSPPTATTAGPHSTPRSPTRCGSPGWRS